MFWKNSGSQGSPTGRSVVGKIHQVVCVYKYFDGSLSLSRNSLLAELNVLLLYVDIQMDILPGYSVILKFLLFANQW